MQEVHWCAIGDSFTYLNDHLDETGFRVHKGYLTRTCERFVNLQVQNLGINGSRTGDWLTAPLAAADVYTVLLGTNDWFAEVPLGITEDFSMRREGSILGNLGCLIGRLRETAPSAPVLVMTPVERGDFVYLFDADNHAHGSYAPCAGRMLSEVAAGIAAACRAAGISVLDLHEKTGITPENAVRFKRVRTPEGYRDLPYPAYLGIPVRFGEDENPYPPQAQDYTYDGLHPSDKGNEVIAALLAAELEEIMRKSGKPLGRKTEFVQNQIRYESAYGRLCAGLQNTQP